MERVNSLCVLGFQTVPDSDCKSEDMTSFTSAAGGMRVAPMLRRTINLAPKLVLALGAAAALSGCHMDVMDPKGPVGLAEKDLIILSVLLMLIPVVPVIFMTLWFAWRYRASNKTAKYAPDFEHSNRIEAVVWAIPCLIILALGAVTWVSTHELDPRKVLTPVAGQTHMKPVEVEVVSLDWKWLFIYPDYSVASGNEMALPVGTPVHFRLTSTTVMNSFFIPQLGSQIYTMPGMETQLYLRADQAGTYDGVSANYSGHGFAGMKFAAKAVDQAGFDAWIAKAKTSGPALDTTSYATLAKPSEDQPASFYGSIDPMLYHRILNKCADGSTCTEDGVKMAMVKTMSAEQCAKKPERKS